MKGRERAIRVFAVVTLAAATAVSAQSSGWTQRGQGVDVCTSFPLISGTIVAAAGATAGIVGLPGVGEIYQISVTGPGTGTFRIVGDAAGAVTYAGPANVPATLSYTVTSSTLPVGAIGVGYFFSAGAGNVTIAASCSRAAVPGLGAWGSGLLGLLVALGGLAGVALVRRRAHFPR